MNTSNESTDFHVLSLGRSPDGAGFKHVVVIAVAGGRSCGHVMRCKNRDHWIKESARKGRNGRVLNLPRKTDHRDGEVPKETAHFWSISDSFRGDFQGGALSTKMVRRSILSSFLGKIRETPEKQNLMILPWMMRGPEALTSSSPLSFQLLFLFPSSASSRAEASSCKMAGMNPGGTSLRILRLPVVNFIYVLSPWAHRILPFLFIWRDSRGYYRCPLKRGSPESNIHHCASNERSVPRLCSKGFEGCVRETAKGADHVMKC